MRDIAGAVRVQSGSIFYHFRSKEELLIAVMLEGMRKFAVAAREPLADAHTPLDRLHALFYGHLTALHGGGDEQAVVIQEWRNLSAPARRRVVRVRDEIEAMWRDTLAECAEVNLVHGDLRLLRLSMLGALNWTLQWYRPKGPLNIRELAEHLLSVFVPAADPNRDSGQTARRRKRDSPLRRPRRV